MNKRRIFILYTLLISLICLPVYADDTVSRELKELDVKNHKIYFYKERTEYKLLLEEGENTLDITAIPEDERSKVEVKGADNLEENDYVVTVKVTDTNGKEMTYTIKAEKKEVIEEEKELGFFEKIQDNISKINFKIEWLFIGAGIIAAIFGIFKGISIVKGKNIDDTMDNF